LSRRVNEKKISDPQQVLFEGGATGEGRLSAIVLQNVDKVVPLQPGVRRLGQFPLRE